MDLDAVRAFVAVVDVGRFSGAADELSLTQQAVSKRVAALERDLGVRLLTRAARGAGLTVDGQAFLPRARDLLRAEQRAAACVRPGRRPLRVDVIGRRLAPAVLLNDFHRAHPEAGLEVATLFDADAAIRALRSGAIDASFRAITVPPWQLPAGLEAVRVLDEPVQLLTGPAHELADAPAVALPALAGQPIWMPGIIAGTEWGAYYSELAANFGLDISPVGPGLGAEPVLDVIARSPALATLVGERTRLLWPADYDLRRIPLRGPKPVYPHSLVFCRDNPHPALAALRAHLGAVQAEAGTWTPRWAEPIADGRTGSDGAPGGGRDGGRRALGAARPS